MTKIVREDAEITITTITPGDVSAPIQQNITLLDGLESKTLFEQDGRKNIALLESKLQSDSITCITTPTTPPCIGTANYKISKSVGLHLLKSVECNGEIKGIPPQAGTDTPTTVKCTVQGNTKTIFVKD
jgi:hypothetical protein